MNPEKPVAGSSDGSRRVYILWAVALGLFLMLSAFIWFLLVPFLQTRAAVARCLAGSSSTVPAELKRFGTPERAVGRLGLYLRSPARLAPHRVMAVRMLGCCGEEALPKLRELWESHSREISAVAAQELGKHDGYSDVLPPNSPVHLVDQADLILLLRLQPAGAGGMVRCEIVRCLKGQTPAAPTIDLGKAIFAKHARQVQAAIAGLADPQALLLVGLRGLSSEWGPGALLHVAGKWVRLEATGPDAWGMESIALDMAPVWDGDTESLVACADLLRRYPDSAVASDVPVTWREEAALGRVAGRVTDLQAVDLDGKGALRLLVASEAGDRMFRYDAQARKFRDETEALKLTSRSRAAAWVDFDGDGRLDLASWDGRILALHLQDAGGSFKPAAPVAGAPAGECLGLAALDAGEPGRPGLLWSAKGGPVLLAPDKAGGFTVRRLEPAGGDLSALGAPGRCLVADFDGDGLPDVLQPFAAGSLLFRGKSRGQFAAAENCAVALGVGRAWAFLGDWDHDGRLDVFTASESGCRLWVNRPGLAFEDKLEGSGPVRELARKAAVWGGACDLNGDGREDLFALLAPQAGGSPALYFNRGFRNFLPLRMMLGSDRRDLPAGGLGGQQWGLVADLDGDGAQDLVLAGSSGELRVFLQEVRDLSPLALRVALPLNGPTAGPVKVEARIDGRSLGARSVSPGTSEAFFGLAYAGEVEVRWRLPDGRERSKKIEAEDKPVRLIIPVD